jgi:hypothetical protein
MPHPRVQARVAALLVLVTGVTSLAADPLHGGSASNAAAPAGQRVEVLTS